MGWVLDDIKKLLIIVVGNNGMIIFKHVSILNCNIFMQLNIAQQ